MTWLEPKSYLDPATGPGALVLGVVVLARLASGLLDKLIRRSTWLMDRFGRQTDETVTLYVLLVKTVVLVYLVAGARSTPASFPPLQAF